MERRTLLKRAIVAINTLVGALLGVPIVAYLIDPRNRPAPPGKFTEVARLEELQPGIPKEVVVRQVRRDAWTLHPNDIIGRVWLLRRKGQDGTDQVQAFTTVCPHLGCSINFLADSGRFQCPCHNGAFALDGRVLTQAELGRKNAAPRDMDSLACEMRDGVIAVRYQDFVQGLHDKVVKT